MIKHSITGSQAKACRTWETLERWFQHSSGRWFQPLRKILVNWDECTNDIIPNIYIYIFVYIYIWKNIKNVPNHRSQSFESSWASQTRGFQWTPQLYYTKFRPRLGHRGMIPSAWSVRFTLDGLELDGWDDPWNIELWFMGTMKPKIPPTNIFKAPVYAISHRYP